MATTANFGWDIGFKGKNPWWETWDTLWDEVDAHLYFPGFSEDVTPVAGDFLVTAASEKVTIANLSKALGWVDVRAYGAKGDGVTDDTAAIQAAYNTLPYGGIVFIPPNLNCLITSKISLPYSIVAPGVVPSIWKLFGYGSKLTFTGSGTMFEAAPPDVASINTVLKSYNFEGLGFVGPNNRTSIAIDLQCHSNSNIKNCGFAYFGTQVRLVYSFWPKIECCNFYDAHKTAIHCATGYEILPGGGSAGAQMGGGHMIDTCHFYSDTAVKVDIEGMTRAAACVVTWTGHGMVSGDIVFFCDITQADWTYLNKTRQTITRINDDSFSIPVNTSAYAADYLNTDPGYYVKFVSSLMIGPGHVNLRNVGVEGNSGVDEIYYYGEGTSLGYCDIFKLYTENVPNSFGSKICLNEFAGYLSIDGFSLGTNDNTLIDAYEAKSCVLQLKNLHIVGTGNKFRATRTTKAVNVAWDFKGFGSQNESSDPSLVANWIDAIKPSDGYGYTSVDRMDSSRKINVDFYGVTFESRVNNNPIIAFVANDDTPGIQAGNFFKTANTNPTTITMFDNGNDGQSIKVLINDAVTTIQFRDAGHPAAHLRGNAGLDWTPTTGDWLEAVFDGTDWYCSCHDCTA